MKLKKAISFVLATISIFLFGACIKKPTIDQSALTQATEYKKITADQAKALIDGGGVIILDVRTPEEFDQGHIKGALLLPDYEVGAKAATILPDKDAKILIYCRSGHRSALAAKELIVMGYSDVLDFGGLQTDWPYETVVSD